MRSLRALLGRPLPCDAQAVNKGWYEPNNPASCFECGLMGQCEHDTRIWIDEASNITPEMMASVFNKITDLPNEVDGIIRVGNKEYDQSGKELKHDKR